MILSDKNRAVIQIIAPFMLDKFDDGLFSEVSVRTVEELLNAVRADALDEVLGARKVALTTKDTTHAG